MGATVLAVTSVASLALGGIGMGMQYAAQRQAASQQAAMARYNYAIEAQNIRQQQAMAMWQANAAAKQAEANAAQATNAAALNARVMQDSAKIQADYMRHSSEQNALSAEAQAAMNAGQLDANAAANIRRGVEDTRRTREEQLRFMAIQRGKQARSGVVTGVGTPVEVLAESAKNMQLAINDSWFETTVESSRLQHGAEVERWRGNREASLERWKGERGAAAELYGADQNAMLELYGGAAQAADFMNQSAMARAEGAYAPIKARNAMRSAKMSLLGGMNDAKGYKSAANAGLVAGGASLLSQGSNLYSSGAFSGGGKKQVTNYSWSSPGQSYVKIS